MSSKETRFFQFLQGERRGEILSFDHIEREDDMVFVTFTDGSRCNESLIIPINQKTYSDELMAEIDSPNNGWGFRDEWVGRQEEIWADQNSNGDRPASGERVCIQPFAEGRKKTIPTPPKQTKSRFGQIERSIGPEIITNVIPEQSLTVVHSAPSAPIQDTTDPIYIMCEKSKKFDVDVNMSINISLPKKSLYNVVKESFENGSEKFIEYIISNIDNNIIKEGLKKSLLEAYEEIDDLNKIE